MCELECICNKTVVVVLDRILLRMVTFCKLDFIEKSDPELSNN